MKQFYSILLLTALLVSVSSFKSANNDNRSNGNQPRIEVVFNRQMDFNHLVKLKLDLSQKGIVLNYNKLEFDKEGKLQFINFSVDCNDGFKGGAERRLSQQGRFGFYRDYSKDAKTPFEAGNL